MRSMRNAVVLGFASMLLSGCATWVPSSPERVTRDRPSLVLLQDVDGATHRVKDPRIEEGRVIGERWGRVDAPVSVPLEAVRSIRQRQVSPGRTILFLIPTGFAVLAAFTAAALSSS